MKARELLKILKDRGCTAVRQNGSHLIVSCGACQAVIPTAHRNYDLKSGTLLSSIQRQLEPCLGKRWLKDT